MVSIRNYFAEVKVLPVLLVFPIMGQIQCSLVSVKSPIDFNQLWIKPQTNLLTPKQDLGGI